MAYAWLCTFSFFLLFAGLGDATDYNILDFAMARRHELWMAEYGKVYNNDAEKAERFKIFKKNVKYIENYNNARNHSNTLGVNEFTDLTKEEVVARYTGFKIPERELEEIDDVLEEINVSALPSSVDWRKHNAVSRVKHQGNCSCCWAFTGVATVEGLIAIKTNVLHDLSVQQVVDCDTVGTHCNPGYIENAYDYIIRNGGITTWTNYPYTAVEGVCDAIKEAATVTTIGGYKEPRRNSESSLLVAVARQPVGVAIDANSTELQAHKKGIFSGPCGKTVNHAVTIVGYGEEGSTKFWIVKNSWGGKWGESGYVRMERGVSSRQGLCGIASWPIHPTI